MGNEAEGYFVPDKKTQGGRNQIYSQLLSGMPNLNLLQQQKATRGNVGKQIDREMRRFTGRFNPDATPPPPPPRQQAKATQVAQNLQPGLRNRQRRGRAGTLLSSQSTGLLLSQSNRPVTGG